MERKNMKTVAIIGAGVAGIATAKTASQAGFLPTVFEKASHVGGLWSPVGLTWDSMHTNIANFTVAYSDFPWPLNSLVFPNAREVYQYLLNYIENFNIKDRFRLNNKVTYVKLLNDKRWQVASEFEGHETVEIFDYCIVSTGFNTKPHTPDEYAAGKRVFKGEFLHSADYRSNKDRLKSKNVLIIGGSVSAIEISCDLVNQARSVTNLFRSKYLVVPKIFRDKADDATRVLPLDAIDSSRKNFNSMMEGNFEFCKNLYRKACAIQTDESKSDPALFMDLEKIDFATLKFSVSDDYVSLVQESRIKAKQGFIKSFLPNGIVADDDTFIEADVIIFCTSHKMDLSFFDEDTLKILNYDRNCLNDPIGLYKNTWHPDLPNMAFVGTVQSVICIVGELQAIWAFRVFKNELPLPAREIMLKSIAEEVEKREKNKNVQFPYPFNYLCDMIACEAGLLDLEKEKRKDPVLYEMLWNGPILPEHFQLNDPVKREAAIEQIKLVNARFSRVYSQEESDSITVHNFV